MQTQTGSVDNFTGCAASLHFPASICHLLSSLFFPQLPFLISASSLFPFYVFFHFQSLGLCSLTVYIYLPSLLRYVCLSLPLFNLPMSIIFSLVSSSRGYLPTGLHFCSSRICSLPLYFCVYVYAQWCMHATQLRPNRSNTGLYIWRILCGLASSSLCSGPLCLGLITLFGTDRQTHRHTDGDEGK